MTDDPRLAALEEACRAALTVHEAAQAINREEGLDIFDPADAAEAFAAAILDVLDGWMLVPRMDPQSPDEWIQPAMWQGEVLQYEAEIDRLRKIEEAARDFLADWDGFDDMRPSRASDALRAALAGGSE